MKLHRAITLIVMIGACVFLLAVSLGSRAGGLGSGGLEALLLVLLAAAAAGIAFSWKRYFPRRP